MSPVAVTPSSIVSPADQRVSFVELFFDLVFVFCVTQVVQLLHDGYSAGALVRATLVFWLVWWCWTQFTWTLNAADTSHHKIELATLVATGVAFFMAVAIPQAFSGKARTFALAYVAARLIGLAMQSWVARAASPKLHATATRFMLTSFAGLIAVLVGAYLGGMWQYYLWGAAILLDALAAYDGGDADWNLHADHFAERHGLFVIITLGETLIVTGAGVTNKPWTQELLTVAVMAVACTGGLWWVYFVRAKPALDRAFEQKTGAAQSRLARDAYSLLHFPIVFGLITFAVTIGEAIAHPGEPLKLSYRVGLAVGMILYLAGMSAGLQRASARALRWRVPLTVVLAVLLIAVSAGAAVITFAVLLIGLFAVAAAEQRAVPSR